jgi:DDE family transposase
MPKGPRKLVVTFGNQTLTHYGGVYLLHRFLTRIGLKNAIATEIRFIQRNNRYTVGELLLAILYPIILGLERIETTQLLQHNGVFRYLSGLPTYPDPSTLRRFLLRVAPQALTRLRKLHDRLLAKMIAKPHLPSRVIFDLDSTVLVVYGKQQGAEVGYNPTKRGRRSYHPLLCFEGRTKDFWHGELRPGNVHTASGTPGFAQSLLCQNPFGNQICDHPRRQRILRPPDRGVAGGVQSSLCHRRQTHPTYQTQVGSPEIRLGEDRSANSRILLSAHSLVSSLPLRSYSTTSARRVGPTADLVQARELPLPGPGYQSRSETPQPLALLQWSSGNRTDYPGAQGRLPFGQDPHPSLPRQRGLLASLTIGLQLSELVQAAVFAPGVSDRYARYFAQSHSVNACTTASDRQSAPTGYARRWPTGKRLEACVA